MGGTEKRAASEVLEVGIMRKSSAVHSESWTYPQEERETVELIADIWRENGRQVTIEEDTNNISVASVSVFVYDIAEGVDIGDDEAN